MPSDLLRAKRALPTRRLRSSRDWGLPGSDLSKSQGSKEQFPLVLQKDRLCSGLFCPLASAHEGLHTKRQGVKAGVFLLSSAMLSCNDICPSKELFSLCLNVDVPNTCSSVFVLWFLNQRCLDLNQNIGKQPLQGEKSGCV